MSVFRRVQRWGSVLVQMIQIEFISAFHCRLSRNLLGVWISGTWRRSSLKMRWMYVEFASMENLFLISCHHDKMNSRPMENNGSWSPAMALSMARRSVSANEGGWRDMSKSLVEFCAINWRTETLMMTLSLFRRHHSCRRPKQKASMCDDSGSSLDLWLATTAPWLSWNKLDFQLPERFNLSFASQDSVRGGFSRPVIIHRGQILRLLALSPHLVTLLDSYLWVCWALFCHDPWAYSREGELLYTVFDDFSLTIVFLYSNYCPLLKPLPSFPSSSLFALSAPSMAVT